MDPHKEIKMRLQKSLPLFLVVAFTMALAMGCAPAEKAAETTSSESAGEMGHDDSMAMPDSSAMDTTGMSGMDHSEESSGH
jgi:hypothetical protein